MREPKRKQTIKEWELEIGIKIIEPKGFTNWNGKSRILTNKYTKEQFRRGIEKSIISVKTAKGMEFYEGKDIFNNEYWRNYIKFNNQKEARNDNYRTRQKRNYQF